VKNVSECKNYLFGYILQIFKFLLSEYLRFSWVQPLFSPCLRVSVVDYELVDYVFFCFNSRIRRVMAGTTWNRSPTMP